MIGKQRVAEECDFQQKVYFWNKHFLQRFVIGAQSLCGMSLRMFNMQTNPLRMIPETSNGAAASRIIAERTCTRFMQALLSNCNDIP